MLVDLMSGAPVKRVPYETEDRRFMSRMTECGNRQHQTAAERDDRGHRNSDAGWMPGEDWSDTPFDPIYQKQLVVTRMLPRAASD